MKNRNLLIKSLLEHGYRIFNSSDFKTVAENLGYSMISVRQILFEIKKSNIIHMIRPGLYHLDSAFLASPISEYEIAQALAPKGFLSYLSAIYLHQLTDQLPNIIYITVPLNKHSTPKKKAKGNFDYEILGVKYKIIDMKEECFLGIENKWIGDMQIKITNIEKTLVDAINKPQYCGGFREVFHYFEQAADKIVLEKMIYYAKCISNSCLQRLGWYLDELKLISRLSQPLYDKEFTTMVKLDVTGPRKGRYNKRWHIIENI